MSAKLDIAKILDADANGWMPIETAPNDGTPILVWDGGVHTAWFEREYSWVSPGGAWIGDYARSDTYEFSPDHWQPLPKPPVSAS